MTVTIKPFPVRQPCLAMATSTCLFVGAGTASNPHLDLSESERWVLGDARTVECSVNYAF